ncbi:MAG TPA: DUF4386 domain-containing protein [Candidatus Acidoferrales bacterium]
MNSNSDLEGLSSKVLGRILGVIGLAGIVTGAFDIGYVQMHLIVAGNPAATLQNIAAHESLFRAGFSAHLFELVLNIPGEIITFILLRRVNWILAALAFCCGMVGIAVEAVDLLAAYVPLKLAIESSALGAFTSGQAQGLASLAEHVQQGGLLLSWVFYGVDELASGFLFFRSGFIPRILGLMLALSGLCYFTHGMLSFLAPALDARIYPYIIFPCLPGEVLSSLWLAIMGISLAKWNAWPSKADSLTWA